MNRIGISLIFLVSALFSRAQIQVTSTMTPQQLVDNVLVGSGVTALNVTVNGSTANANVVQPSASYFNQNGTTFPITDGVLLTTGAGSVAVGPNNAAGSSNSSGTLTVTDVDMNAIAAATVTNGIILEFDFVATGNYLEFNYIFGSEEYPEYAPPNNSSFNDIFGFFLSGTGISGPYSLGAINLATVPGTTTPVSINNVNPITNATYYTDNTGGLAYGNAIQYDGTTTTMTAFSDLVCGETYHIKLGVANVGDQAWDSGVFLEGGSFTTNPVEFSFNSYSNNDTISEGCSASGNLIFTRAGCNNANDTLVAYLSYGGSATNGVDFTQLGDSVVMLPGVDTLVWQINPFEDGITEGVESIQLVIMSILLNNDTLYSYGTFYIIDVPDFDVIANDVSLFCLSDSTVVSAVPSGGYAPFDYSWTNSTSTDSSFSFNPTSNGTTQFIVTVTDVCGYVAIDTATVVMNQTLAIDTILTQNASACTPTGWASATVVGVTSNLGQPYYHWTGPGNPGSYNVDGTAITNIPPGWYYFTVEDDVCSAEDSVYIDMTNPPTADFSLVADGACSPVSVSFTNESQNTTTYIWNFGDGSPTVTTVDASHTFTSTSVMSLTAIDPSGCADTAYAQIDVVNCGCTDPTALNYDPNAALDNGTCIYPVPTIVAPNIFTPNGDNSNDVFFLDGTNTESITLIITNRWGNMMYSGSGVNPAWDGKSQNGVAAEDGVYFYKYEAKGIAGDIISGHGFFHLQR